MNIAMGGIAVECCTFSPVLTELDDFEILRGDTLPSRYPFLAHHADTTFAPLFFAQATPGGPVAADAYSQLKSDFLRALREGGPWDGVYLDMHGAMFVEGMQDAEGDWIGAVRAAVGPDCLLAASYDLHGNVSPRVVAALDLLTAYRTAPHEDMLETRARAVDLLLTCLRAGRRPHLTFVPIPILLPGERAMTTAEPAHSLYAALPATIARHDLLDASLLVGYAWADEPRVAASAVAVAWDGAAAKTATAELAAAWWAQRAAFDFGMPTGTVEECIALAQATAARGETPAFLSDAGDNITGGGVGDVPFVLARMLAHSLENAVFAAIADAAAVASAFEHGTGATVNLSLGGKLDTANGTPLDVTGTVLALHTAGSDTAGADRQAVIRVDGIKVVVTSRRTAFTTVAQFEALGIDVTQHAIVGIKLGYLFPDLRRIAAYACLAFSPGAINPDLTQLPYRRLTRPAYPLDAEMEWQPPA